MEQDSRGNVKEEILQNKLNGETGEGKTKVSDDGEVLKVLFIDSGRNYVVDKNGNIRNMKWWETNDEEGNEYITNFAKSITVEDINRITGYDPTNTGDGTVYKEGEIAEYQNEVTYIRESFYNTTIRGINGATGNFEYSSFIYYDENTKNYKDLAVGNSITFTSTYY